MSSVHCNGIICVTSEQYYYQGFAFIITVVVVVLPEHC